MGAALQAVAVAALGLGLLLATIGLYGLLRRPDIFHQLHAAGLVTGPASILVLLASVATRSAEIITSAVLVIVFLLITSPLAGHAIARAARRRALEDAEGAAAGEDPPRSPEPPPG
jgi:multicomponent Na+:H+ antiporter subunit G